MLNSFLVGKSKETFFVVQIYCSQLYLKEQFYYNFKHYEIFMFCMVGHTVVSG